MTNGSVTSAIGVPGEVVEGISADTLVGLASAHGPLSRATRSIPSGRPEFEARTLVPSRRFRLDRPNRELTKVRLTHFLQESLDPILDEAVAFARTIPALQQTDERTLRDHLPELLRVIAADIGASQTRGESIKKSQGNAAAAFSETSAQTHGLMRARDGINIEQLVAEFRALRSSVLRLWADAHAPGSDAIRDIMRFNEAIDQAVAESVQFYANERERWRQIFLGVVGHDLRSPLQAIAVTVEAMQRQAIAPESQTTVLARGAQRIKSLLDTLLEYSRVNLGLGMSLQREACDLATACKEEIELQRIAHPLALIEYEVSGETEGLFDKSRVREALANLVSNAIKHGAPGEPTVVRIEGDSVCVRLFVENSGDLPVGDAELLFEPLYQPSDTQVRTDRTHLGLGLFIVRQIARAHGGEIAGSSSGGRVCFILKLPRA